MKKILCVMFVLILSLGLLAACSNGADDFVPAGFKQIAADEADYRLYVPDNWTVDMSTGVTSAFVSEKDRSNISFMGFELDDSIIRVEINNGTSAEQSEEPVDSSEDVVVSSTPDTSEALPSSELDTSSPAETTEAKDEADTTERENNEVPTITTLEEYWAYYSAEFQRTFPDMEYITEGENMLVSGLSAKKYVYTATVTGQSYQFMQVITIKAGIVYIFTYTATVDNYETHLEDVNSILGYLELK